MKVAVSSLADIRKIAQFDIALAFSMEVTQLMIDGQRAFEACLRWSTHPSMGTSWQDAVQRRPGMKACVCGWTSTFAACDLRKTGQQSADRVSQSPSVHESGLPFLVAEPGGRGNTGRFMHVRAVPVVPASMLLLWLTTCGAFKNEDCRMFRRKSHLLTSLRIGSNAARLEQAHLFRLRILRSSSMVLCPDVNSVTQWRWSYTYSTQRTSLSFGENRTLLLRHETVQCPLVNRQRPIVVLTRVPPFLHPALGSPQKKNGSLPRRKHGRKRPWWNRQSDRECDPARAQERQGVFICKEVWNQLVEQNLPLCPVQHWGQGFTVCCIKIETNFVLE